MQSRKEEKKTRVNIQPAQEMKRIERRKKNQNYYYTTIEHMNQTTNANQNKTDKRQKNNTTKREKKIHTTTTTIERHKRDVCNANVYICIVYQKQHELQLKH